MCTYGNSMDVKMGVKQNAKSVHEFQTCHPDDVRGAANGYCAAFCVGIYTEMQVCTQLTRNLSVRTQACH